MLQYPICRRPKRRQSLGPDALTPRTWKGTERGPGTAIGGPDFLTLITRSKSPSFHFIPTSYPPTDYSRGSHTMSTESLARILNTLSSHPDLSSCCVYGSSDGVNFVTCPLWTQAPGFSESTDAFSGVLHELRPRFAVQASSNCIKAAIDSAYVVIEWAPNSH